MRLKGLAGAAMACAVAGGMTAGGLVAGAATASASDYGPGAVYEVEIAANAPDGSFWVWAALYDNNGVKSVNYEETDCVHLPHIATAAANDAGDGRWDIKDGALNLYGVNIIAKAATANFTVPLPSDGASYGHSSGLTVTITSEVQGGPPLPAAFLYAPGPESQNQIAP